MCKVKGGVKTLGTARARQSLSVFRVTMLCLEMQGCVFMTLLSSQATVLYHVDSFCFLFHDIMVKHREKKNKF